MSAVHRDRAVVAVLGTGALGCLFAARLSAVADVWMLGTWTEALAAIERDGVTVEERDCTWRAQVHVAAGPDACPPADYALVLVKAYQTRRAARWAAGCLGGDGLAVTLQNGLGNYESLVAAVGQDRCAAGVTFEGATLLGPGHIRHAGSGATELGAPAGGPPATARLARLLQEAGFRAALVPDIAAALWGKAVINAAINPLAAIWRVPNGELLDGDDRQALLAALAGEAAAVARAAGVQLPYADAAARVVEVCRATAANRSSMLQDVLNGRETEIESINGVIVAEGRRLGIPVPTNETVLRLVRGAHSRPEA